MHRKEMLSPINVYEFETGEFSFVDEATVARREGHVVLGFAGIHLAIPEAVVRNETPWEIDLHWGITVALRDGCIDSVTRLDRMTGI